MSAMYLYDGREGKILVFLFLCPNKVIRKIVIMKSNKCISPSFEMVCMNPLFARYLQHPQENKRTHLFLMSLFAMDMTWIEHIMSHVFCQKTALGIRFSYFASLGSKD